MKLSELQIGSKAVIKTVTCNDELKQRFYSFGMIKGSAIEVEAISLARNTIEVLVEDTSIGIRVEEASNIEVELV